MRKMCLANPLNLQIRRQRYYNMTTSKNIGLGKETLFEFKYIPSYSRTTHPGKRKMTSPASKGLESLGTFGIFIAIVTLASLGLLFVLLVILSRFLSYNRICALTQVLAQTFTSQSNSISTSHSPK